MSIADRLPERPINSPVPRSQPAEQRVILENVSWATYVSLADETDVSGGVRGRMCFDQGVLEIMSPGQRHEEFKNIIRRMIDTWTMEKGINVKSTASTTFRLEPDERAFEGDESYYIANAHIIQGLKNIDLSIHPGPDLVIEIDLTNSSRRKFDIYESLRVAEVWIFDGERIRVHVRAAAGGFSDADNSQALPGFPVDRVAAVMSDAEANGETAAIRGFRDSLSTV